MADVDLEYAWFFRTEFSTVLRTAFIQLLSHWKKVSRYERPDAWVRRVAVRLAVRALKRDRLRALLEQHETEDHGLDVPDVDLARAVQQLSAMQRSVVVLFYFEDRPIAEIVDILGVSEGTVKVHLHRARQRLAAILGEKVDEDAR